MSRTVAEVFVTILIDGKETEITAKEAGLTAGQARLINSARVEYDEELERFKDYDRHYLAKYINNARARAKDDFTSNETDPLENIADPNADIFNTLFPEKQRVSPASKSVKRIISTLPDTQKDFYEKRYVYGLTYEEIGIEEKDASGKAVTKQAAHQRDVRLKSSVKKKLTEGGESPFLQYLRRGG